MKYTRIREGMHVGQEMESWRHQHEVSHDMKLMM